MLSRISDTVSIIRIQHSRSIHRRSQSQIVEDRLEAAKLLAIHFSNLPYKAEAWQDLIRLAQDDYGSIRENAAKALGTNFNQIPDRDQAWENLHKLDQDHDICVRAHSARALGINFSRAPNRDQAWQDLYGLSQDESGYARGEAAIYPTMCSIGRRGRSCDGLGASIFLLGSCGSKKIIRFFANINFDQLESHDHAIGYQILFARKPTFIASSLS